MFYSLMKIKGMKTIPLVNSEPLPLSSKSQLAWLGFCDEGAPAFYDSKGIVRVLNGRLWSTYCSLRDLLQNENDHFWLLGASEATQNIRAVKCKGTRFPPALPRPILLTIDAKV